MNKYDVNKFNSCKDFITYAVNTLGNVADFNDNNYSSIAILCTENLAEILFKMLSVMDFDGFSFDYEFIEFDKEFEKEYAILISNDGVLSMEKAWYDDDTCKFFEENIILVNDLCNSKLLVNQTSKNNNVICFHIEAKKK